MMKSKAVGIIGLGSYLPDKVMTNGDLEKLVDTDNEWIIERTGIETRRIAADDQATSDLAYIASQRALKDAGVDASEIDLILVATVTPDMPFPATACLLQERLGASRASAMDISAGCSGFVYGMVTGSQFIQTGLYKKVLVVGAETMSRIVDWQDRNTCVLFGDGAGAAVLGEVEEGYGILSADLGADGSGADMLKISAGGSKLPTSSATLAAREHYMVMNGNEVFKFAIKIMGETVLKTLNQAGLGRENIDLLVPHQANMRIIRSAAKRLKVPLEKVIVNINKYGNMSAACIPIALDEARSLGRLNKGQNAVVVGFGAGLTWASSVIKWSREEKTIDHEDRLV